MEKNIVVTVPDMSKLTAALEELYKCGCDKSVIEQVCHDHLTELEQKKDIDIALYKAKYIGEYIYFPQRNLMMKVSEIREYSPEIIIFCGQGLFAEKTTSLMDNDPKFFRFHQECEFSHYITDDEDVIQIIDKPVEFMETNYPYIFNFFNPIVF